MIDKVVVFWYGAALMVDSTRQTNVKWQELEAPRFVPHIQHRHDDYSNCGAAILSLITGESPKSIEKKYPKIKKGMPSATFAAMLRGRGYTVVTVAKNNVTKVSDLPAWRCWKCRPINDNHVLVMNIHVTNKENSMFLLNQGILWHHFEPLEYDPLFLLNKPTQDVMVVWHPNWSLRPAIELCPNSLERCLVTPQENYAFA